MPVTELAWIPSATPGSIPPAFLEVVKQGIERQSDWAAIHASSTLPSGPPANRGAALYQQLEDRGMILITAHWDSPNQHQECIASEMNQEAMRAIAAHSVVTEVRFLHVDKVQMFGKETLEAGGLLSVLRVGVTEGKRDEIEEIWDNIGKDLVSSSAGLAHVGGWKIEKEQGKEDRDEFVVVGAWRDQDALDKFTSGSEWEEVWKGVALDMDISTYSRID